MTFKPGDLVRSTRNRIFDLIAPDAKSWIPMEPGMLGLVIPNLRDLDTWIRLLTPNGIGDCYCDDVEKV